MTEFKKLNPTIEIVTETEHININGLWNDSSLMCRFQKKQDLSLFDSIILPEEFSALIHKNENCIEFIFGPLHPKDEIVGRKFEFNFNNENFQLSYENSTLALETIAKGFRPNEESTETRYRNLRPFRDFTEKINLLEWKSFLRIECLFHSSLKATLKRLITIQNLQNI